MGILQKIFKRGSNDQAEHEPGHEQHTPLPDVLSEEQRRARELLEKDLEENKARSEGAPE